MMNFQPGEMVEVVDIGQVLFEHPTKGRYVQNGDVLVIKRVTSYYVYFDDSSDKGHFPYRFKKVEQAAIENECTCPDLLNGHYHGCLYIKD